MGVTSQKVRYKLFYFVKCKMGHTIMEELLAMFLCILIWIHSLLYSKEKNT